MNARAKAVLKHAQSVRWRVRRTAFPEGWSVTLAASGSDSEWVNAGRRALMVPFLRPDFDPIELVPLDARQRDLGRGGRFEGSPILEGQVGASFEDVA